ncbi:hypothetical protein SYNTR_1175 [Candidatus Syntrophocurvum alkaliphilum]|uniref:Uncharacterized protein n=1 Tax=Candidatus Syntrophocurvum alkaliphilum TaxID=2293317 RepID=A0A6I6DAB8_9FIRM|nr:hypothetical protein [Candidatus Syntrophocurvum alkaliphilum]QGT99768.1 hypothetical protein SYNTR_1175 [Candidatus Syntrophocurvum alkaliphilum]
MTQKKRMGKDPFEQLEWIQDSRDPNIEKNLASKVQTENTSQEKASKTSIEINNNQQEQILSLLNELNDKLKSFEKQEKEVAQLREEISALKKQLEHDMMLIKNPWMIWFPWAIFKK